MKLRASWRHNPLVVAAVVVVVLVCMIFMPGMAIFALAGAAAVSLLLPRLLRQALRPSAEVGPTDWSERPAGQGRCGPGPPLLSPLRL